MISWDKFRALCQKKKETFNIQRNAKPSDLSLCVVINRITLNYYMRETNYFLLTKNTINFHLLNY